MLKVFLVVWLFSYSVFAGERNIDTDGRGVLSDNTENVGTIIFPVKEKNDPCKEVSCSGHGKCVILEGKPACLCDSGFIPDSKNNVLCVQYQPVVKTIKIVTKIHEKKEEPSLKAINLIPSLPYRSLEQIYSMKAKMKLDLGRDQDLDIVAAGYFRMQKRNGAIIASVGLAMSFVSSFLLAVAINPEGFYGDCFEYYDARYSEPIEKCSYTTQTAYIVTGTLSTVSAVSLISSGLSKLLINRWRLKQLNKH